MKQSHITYGSPVSPVEKWAVSGVTTPSFSMEQMQKATKEHPIWVHFGAGNIFRAFIANLQHRLLERGAATQGVIAVETFDYDMIDKIYTPFDNIALLALMHADGSLQNSLVASIAESLRGGVAFAEEWERLQEIFSAPSLQMVTFTITEKGYALTDLDGQYFPVIESDRNSGPATPSHVMSIVTGLLYRRYQTTKAPVAMVSMDNCSHNGDKLKSSILDIATAWAEHGLVEPGFVDYLSDEKIVSFPWTMIDKITPRPAQTVQHKLEAMGLCDIDPIVTNKNTFIAPFVNAEAPEYLVIEDDFPNGRPPLEEAGVLFADRDTVNNTEKMKVTTCLNPLHTALAVFGCLLGYTTIADEMKDIQLSRLVHAVGYLEGMPVVIDPKIIDAHEFIRQVITQRLPNPYIPDTPQRIAVDTSQKMAIRFGETIKAWIKHPDLDPLDLRYIPLVIAGWLRYLLGVTDDGASFVPSPDPMLASLTRTLADVTVGNPASYQGQAIDILSNATLFGVDLVVEGLSDQVESFFVQMIAGKGAVRETLKQHCTADIVDPRCNKPSTPE